jgi:hypothetical protein
MDMAIAIEDEAEDWSLAHLRYGLFVFPHRKDSVGLMLTIISACITSVMRLVESVRTLDNPDISISLMPVSLWARAEVSAGLIVSCLPLLPRFFGCKNVRTRLEPSKPSKYSRFSSKANSQARVDEYGASLHSGGSVASKNVRGESVIMKIITLNQTSSSVGSGRPRGGASR